MDIFSVLTLLGGLAMFLYGMHTMAYHYHHYAGKGDNRGEVFGLEHAQKHAAAVYARKGEYPSGERCAYVAAHYHARGLLKIEYAAVNKADQHYRKG